MNSKLRILFLCGWYPSRVLPYNGDFIQRHAEAVSLLHNVSVLHIISDKNCTKNIEIASKKINGVATNIAYIKPSKNPITKGIRFYKAYKKLIHKIGDFDVIHLNELFPFGLFTFLQKKPFIVTEHWTDYKPPMNKKIGIIQKKLTQLIGKKASYICPVSNELKDALLNFGIQGTYKIVPNVVDTQLFFPKKNKKINDVFTILHISNMVDAHKNVSGILQAVSKLTIPYKLILIGENSHQYKPMADTLNITKNIDFIEHILHNQIPSYLQQTDVYVSFSNYETWGIVMIEALACGCPVISTNTGILNELQKTEFAKIIAIKDKKALTKALLSVQKSSFDTTKMYNFVTTNFSPQIIANQFTNLYLKTLK